jgi:hypothetical protein
MGTWGPGNFETDLGLDVLDGICNGILAEIRKTFQLRTASLYEAMDDVIVANVDVLATLVSHYRKSPPVRSDEVDKWKSDFLQVYDRFWAPNLLKDIREEQKQYIRERRVIITSTFDRLHRIIEDLEDLYFG